MPASSLLALIDDIATLLDDVAVLTKIATKKTAGVLGDDLALNAEQVAGVLAERELPVVWAVAKGSIRNKLILVPAALALSALLPIAVMPLLMIGGAYLCFEGFEKLAHKALHDKDADALSHRERVEAVADPASDMVAFEKKKIEGAIRTDFILSAEIVVISLGTVADKSFATRAAVLAAISVAMTAFVYGIVGAIVKLDDFGLYLSKRESPVARGFGWFLLRSAPKLMKALSVIGTVAMFLVGGGIVAHGVPGGDVKMAALVGWLDGVPGIGGALAWIAPNIANALIGVIVGAIVLGFVSVGTFVYRKVRR